MKIKINPTANLSQLNSLWLEAMNLLGFSCNTFFFFEKSGKYFFDYQLFLRTISFGTLQIDTRGNIKRNLSMRSLYLLVKLHWNAEISLEPQIETINSAKIRSLAYGVLQQILLLRIPKNDQLSTWLANPSAAPWIYRKTIKRILTLQKKRNELTPEWHDLLGSDAEFFDEPTDQTLPSYDGNQSEWKAVCVFPGNVRGKFWIAPDFIDESIIVPEDATILIFSKARPQCISLFPRAAGIIFIHGGLLSHACSIAREQAIPCVTEVGDAFLAVAKANSNRQIELGEDRIKLYTSP